MTPVSFTIDHTLLDPGIYLQAEPGKCYTYDLRFIAPRVSEQKAIDIAIMHTFEHTLATYLRSEAPFKDSIMYVGPMGCCTGFYLLMAKEVEHSQIAEYLCGAFDYICSIDEIPAANPVQCGNWLLNDLDGAKALAKELKVIFSGELKTEYPTVEQ